MTNAVDDELARARDAYAHHQWNLALDLLKAVDASRPLSAEDLERLAWAARWTGKYGEISEALERAEAAYTAADDRRGMARMALFLANFHSERRNDAVARGWLGALGLVGEEARSPRHERREYEESKG